MKRTAIVSINPSNVDKLMMDAVSDRNFASVGNLEVFRDYYKRVDRIFSDLDCL